MDDFIVGLQCEEVELTEEVYDIVNEVRNAVAAMNKE